jgi:FkbM family methyltransferase
MPLSSRQSLRKLLRPGDGHQVPSPWAAIDLSHTFTSGVSVAVRSLSDWYVFNEVFADGSYDPAIDLFTRTASGDRPVVVDLGANVGFFAARVVDRLRAHGSRQTADLLLVEGSPTVFGDLETRLPGIAIGDFAVSAINALVGPREGSGTISEVEFGARNTMLPGNNTGISSISEMSHHKVAFVDLNDLVGPRRISLLKCDIEGSEQSFVETYSTDLLLRTDVAVFEFHQRLCDVPLCVEILSRCGLDVISTVEQEDETSLALLARVAT